MAQAGFIGQDDSLESVAELQIGEDPSDVGLDRGFAENQFFSEFGVLQAAGEQAQHLHFLWAER